MSRLHFHRLNPSPESLTNPCRRLSAVGWYNLTKGSSPLQIGRRGVSPRVAKGDSSPIDGVISAKRAITLDRASRRVTLEFPSAVHLSCSRHGDGQVKRIRLVKLQLLLRKESRTPQGVAAAKGIALSLGIVPTASGFTSLSAEMQDEAFESLFKQNLRKVEPRAPSAADFGSPGGSSAGPLEVPTALQPYIESITIAPPYIRRDRLSNESSR